MSPSITPKRRSMNVMERTDAKKSNLTLSRTMKAATKNPMQRLSSQQEPQISLIDEALNIMSSPGSSTTTSFRRDSRSQRQGSRMGRRGSALSERRASELLMDNSDHLSTLVKSGIDIDFDSDDESDLDC